MAKETRLSQFYIKHLLSNLTQRGVDTSQFQTKGLWGLKITSLTVPLSDFIGLCELARTELGEPLFSLQIAANTLPPSHGVLGLLMQSCKNMGEAIKLGYKFQHLTRTGHLSSLTFDGHTVTSRLDTKGQDPEFIAPFVEYCQGNLHSIASHLTGHMQTIQALEIHFKHQPRAPIRSYKKILHNDNIKFGQAENQVIFSREVMDMPIYFSDDSAKEKLLDEANRQLREQSTSNSLSEKIKQLLQQQEPFRPLSLEQCAEKLNSSVSTVKRKLQEEESTYRSLLDKVREDLANHYLRGSELSVEQISISIGFSNAAAFSRAFKRWSGQTPQQYRQHHDD